MIIKKFVKSISGFFFKSILAATFFPYVLLPFTTVFYSFSGMTASGWLMGGYITTRYGWEVINSPGAFVLIILIIPCLIYQILYIFIKRLSGDKAIFKKSSKTALITVSVIFITVIIPVSAAEIRADSQRQKLFSEGEDSINAYLIEKYGDDNYAKMKITRSKTGQGDIFDIGKKPHLFYNVTKSPLSDNNFEVILETGGGIYDTAADIAVKERNLEKKFREKYAYKLMPSDNTEQRAGMFGISSEKFHKPFYTDDELLEKMVYKFYSWHITMEKYDEEEALDIIKDLYINYHNEIMKYNIYIQVCFYIDVKIDGSYRNWVSGHYFDRLSYIEVEFEPYDYGEESGIGKTIERFTKDVWLDN